MTAAYWYQTTPQLRRAWQRGWLSCSHVPKSHTGGSMAVTSLHAQLGSRQAREDKEAYVLTIWLGRMDEVSQCGGRSGIDRLDRDRQRHGSHWTS